MDAGAGCGVLALLAAAAGASSVAAVEAHEGLCEVARRAVALNGMGKKVGGRPKPFTHL